MEQATLDVTFKEAVELLLGKISATLVRHRNDAYPQEAVGILCADGLCFPLINQARSSKRFEVSEVLVREAIEALTNAGQQPIAIYHSHPESASGPSNRDIAMMQNMGGALSIIVGQDGIAAWRWDDSLQSVGKVPLPAKG